MSLLLASSSHFQLLFFFFSRTSNSCFSCFPYAPLYSSIDHPVVVYCMVFVLTDDAEKNEQLDEK